MPICSNCSQDNPANARFCLNCGSPLAALSAGKGEERKVVSVLFADLVGFTAASEARSLGGLHRAAEAREHLEKARAIFGSLGALPLVAEVDAVAP